MATSNTTTPAPDDPGWWQPAVLVLDDGSHAICWSNRGQWSVPEAKLFVRAARLVGAKIGGVLSPGRVVAIGTHSNRLSHPSVTDAGQIAVIGVRVPVKTDRL